jgi:hypothetical protein
MPVLWVVVSGIVGAGAGKERTSEKNEDGKFQRNYGWDMAAAAAAFCSFIMF